MNLGKRKDIDSIGGIRNIAPSMYSLGSYRKAIPYCSFNAELVLLPTITPLIF